MTQLAFHNHALQMAHMQADYLVHNTAQLPANIVVPQAAQLISIVYITCTCRR